MRRCGPVAPCCAHASKVSACAALGWLGVCLVGAASVCFLVSNGSFYWLSDSVGSPESRGLAANMADWYLPYLRTSAAYVSIAAALHVIGARWLRVPGSGPVARGQRG